MLLLRRLTGRTTERDAAAVDPPEDVEVAGRRTTEIEFAAYAEDCRLFGFYQLGADRLTDALNEADAYDLKDVLVVRLDNGLGTQARSLTVRRDELLAVRATGPRGDANRRSRRRPSPVTVGTGPYVIHGYVHGLPGADPIGEVRRRKAMVPLTESWIEYRSGGAEHRARAGTIIVNRDFLDWVRLSRDDEVRLPDLPVETAPDPMAKDLTGYIHTEPE